MKDLITREKIRHEQRNTMNCIGNKSFLQVVRAAAQDYKTDIRFQASAIKVLHEAAEAFLIEVLQQAKVVAKYNKRTHINNKDLQIIKFVRRHEPCFRENDW